MGMALQLTCKRKRRCAHHGKAPRRLRRLLIQGMFSAHVRGHERPDSGHANGHEHGNQISATTRA